MRVIAGEARGRPLRAPKGGATRPTADKVKGAIFSMLETLLLRTGDAEAVAAGEGVWVGKRVLDLFAGSGALGIEALSRGAAWADLVDADRGACAAAEANLRATGLADRARVYCLPARAALDALARDRRGYDIILADPPYADPAVPQIVADLAQSALAGPHTVLVVEHRHGVGLEDRYGELIRVRERRHGDTVASIWLGPARASELASGGAAEKELEA